MRNFEAFFSSLCPKEYIYKVIDECNFSGKIVDLMYFKCLETEFSQTVDLSFDDLECSTFCDNRFLNNPKKYIEIEFYFQNLIAESEFYKLSRFFTKYAYFILKYVMNEDYLVFLFNSLCKIQGYSLEISGLSKLLLICYFLTHYSNFKFERKYFYSLIDEYCDVLVCSLIETKNTFCMDLFFHTIVVQNISINIPTFLLPKNASMLPDPFIIAEHFAEFSENQLYFASHSLQWAYCCVSLFVEPSFDYQSSITPFIVHFLAHSELTRGAFCHALFILFKNTSQSECLRVFFKRLDTQYGVIILKDLLLYNTSKSFYNILRIAGTMFFSVYIQKQTLFEDAFQIVLNPMSFDYKNSIDLLCQFDYKENPSLYLNGIIIFLWKYSFSKPLDSFETISKNLNQLVCIIENITKFFYDQYNSINSLSINLLCTIIISFFKILQNLFAEDTLIIPYFSTYMCDKILYVLNYILTCSIPPLPNFLSFKIIESYHSVTNFIWKNKNVFSMFLYKHFRPSLISSNLIASSICFMEMSLLIDFIETAVYSSLPLVQNAASIMIASHSSNKGLANSMMYLFFNTIHNSSKNSSISFDICFTNMIFFFYVASKHSGSFIADLIGNDFYSVFIEEVYEKPIKLVREKKIKLSILYPGLALLTELLKSPSFLLPSYISLLELFASLKLFPLAIVDTILEIVIKSRNKTVEIPWKLLFEIRPPKLLWFVDQYSILNPEVKMVRPEYKTPRDEKSKFPWVYDSPILETFSEFRRLMKKTSSKIPDSQILLINEE